MRILIVDDEKNFARTLAERLTLRQLQCLLAHDAEEALRVLEEAVHAEALPDLVFLDVHLPGMSGIELLPLLRERYPDMDVVMLSGATELQTAVRAMRRGAANWLPKPVEVDALLEECHRSLERRRQRRHESQLAEAAMLGSLGRVAEGVAHEVNNPVNIMTQAAGWVEDILDEGGPHRGQVGTIVETASAEVLHEIRTALHTIRVQSMRVREITRRLLVFGKGMDTTHAPLDIADIVRKAVEMLAGQAAQNTVTVSTDIPSHLPQPKGSAVELHQACVHVLENALEAMPQGGTVHIHATLRPATESIDAAYLLQVDDSGPGIAPDVLAQVFDPFFSTKPKNAGLGLAVCRSLMRRQSGDAQAESIELSDKKLSTQEGTQPLYGTRVTLALPL